MSPAFSVLLHLIGMAIGVAIGVAIAWFIEVKPIRPKIRRIRKEKFDRVTRGRRIW